MLKLSKCTNEKLMTVGEIAKAARVSVRTIQYYDQCYLLKASAYSEGGYRLYSNKDLVMIHQIKSLKHMGLTLSEIKKQLISLDKPEKVLTMVRKQKEIIKKNIENLQNTLEAMGLFEEEIAVKNSVDFAKYAKIIADSQDKQDNLWAWVFDMMEEDLREHIDKFDEKLKQYFYDYLMKLMEDMIQAQKEGISPKEKKGQELAARFWEMVEKFLDEKSDLMSSLSDFAVKLMKSTNGFADKWKQIDPFINEALGEYFKNNNMEEYL